MATLVLAQAAAKRRGKRKQHEDCHTKHDKFNKGTHEMAEVLILSETISSVMEETLALVSALDNSKPATKAQLSKLKDHIAATTNASKSIETAVNEIMYLNGVAHVGKRLSSSIRSQQNLQAKMNDRLGRGRDKENEPLQQLKAMLPTSANNKRQRLDVGTTVVSPEAMSYRASPRLVQNRLASSKLTSGLPMPQNGECYSLREAVLMLHDKKGVHPIVNELQKETPWLVLASYSTIRRRILDYNATGNLPDSNESGLQEGRPRLLREDEIHLLNEDIGSVKDMVEDLDALGDKLASFGNDGKKCSKATENFYNSKASALPGTSLTKKSTTRLSIFLNGTKLNCMSLRI